MFDKCEKLNFCICYISGLEYFFAEGVCKKVFLNMEKRGIVEDIS
jgi:hypothetical protein